MEKIGFASERTEKSNYDEAKSKVLEALKDHFRPEWMDLNIYLKGSNNANV
jgi:hypothetical protein